MSRYVSLCLAISRYVSRYLAISPVPGIKLTLLTEVAQNGVHALESVAGNVLCERAMKTLLEGSTAQPNPSPNPNP